MCLAKKVFALPNFFDMDKASVSIFDEIADFSNVECYRILFGETKIDTFVIGIPYKLNGDAVTFESGAIENPKINKIIVDIDSDTDNIYQIKFIKHLSGSITCMMINDWCDFPVDFDEYGYKLHYIVKEFNDKVKEHKKCWSLLSSRGCKIHNYKFQEDIYSVYVLTRKYA